MIPTFSQLVLGAICPAPTHTIWTDRKKIKRKFGNSFELTSWCLSLDKARSRQTRLCCYLLKKRSHFSLLYQRILAVECLMESRERKHKEEESGRGDMRRKRIKKSCISSCGQRIDMKVRQSGFFTEVIFYCHVRKLYIEQWWYTVRWQINNERKNKNIPVIPSPKVKVNRQIHSNTMVI